MNTFECSEQNGQVLFKRLRVTNVICSVCELDKTKWENHQTILILVILGDSNWGGAFIREGYLF